MKNVTIVNNKHIPMRARHFSASISPSLQPENKDDKRVKIKMKIKVIKSRKNVKIIVK